MRKEMKEDEECWKRKKDFIDSRNKEFKSKNDIFRNKQDLDKKVEVIESRMDNFTEIINDNRKGYYRILGIAKEAKTEEISKAFKKSSLIFHPDKGGDPEQVRLNFSLFFQFRYLYDAKETLLKDNARIVYDYYGATKVQSLMKKSDESRLEECANTVLKITREYSKYGRNHDKAE